MGILVLADDPVLLILLASSSAALRVRYSKTCTSWSPKVRMRPFTEKKGCCTFPLRTTLSPAVFNLFINSLRFLTVGVDDAVL